MRILVACWLVWALAGLVEARRKLSTNSLVSCMENSQLTAKSFDVVFNPDDLSLNYRLDLNTEIDGRVRAVVEVWAYGFKVITEQMDLCALGWKQFCPLTPGEIQIQAVQYVSESYAARIPGVAYQVPDIDAYLKVMVLESESDNQVACIQAYFTNGRTVAQTAVKWATATIAGLGLFASAILSAFGNSNAASHISATTMSLFLYFQSVVVVSMENVERLPPIADAWAQNLAWSMGLIRVEFMQRIFRWYVEASGGDPTLHLTSKSTSVLAQRSLDVLTGLPVLKATESLYGSAHTMIFRGIQRLAFRARIENSAVVCTGLTFFLLFGYLLAVAFTLFKGLLDLLVRLKIMDPLRFLDFRKTWVIVLKGVLLRYIFLGFTQLTILCFWEFVKVDSPALVVLAVLSLILSLSIMLWAAYRTIYFGRASISVHSNPAAILYGNESVLHKYGFFYTMYSATHYWWSCMILAHILLKAVFISFAHNSGKTQAVALFVIEILYLAALIKCKPYLDRATNILNIMISSVTLANSFLFLFFSGLFGQPSSVSSIMAWIFFILNSAFSLILLIMILVCIGLVIFTRNPDLRFKPARDDRRSFQRKSTINMLDKSSTAELLALGTTAKAHNENWEDELKKQQSVTIGERILTPENSPFEEPSPEPRISMASYIKRKFSLKRDKSTRSNHSQYDRLQD
ncbi:AaceriAFL120Wp [[Ashbya] aceris (nom. inval.)]|nr:AaceriAFL120Wp [[Ashbya] aceris (nom. inval.)]